MSKNLKKNFQKVTFLFFLCSIFLCCFTFRDRLLTQMIQLGINWVIKPSSFINFKVKKMQFGLDGACFEGVKLEDKNQSFSLNLDRVKLCLTKKRHKISCQLDNARFLFDDNQVDLGKGSVLKLLHYFDFNLFDAIIELKNRALEIPFTLKANQELIHLSSSKESREFFNAKIYLKESRDSLLEIKNVALAKVLPLVQILWPNYPIFDAKKGIVSAMVSTQYDNGAFRLQTANATFKDTLLSDTTKDVDFKCDSLIINFQVNSSDFNLKSHLRGGNISFNNGFHESRLSFNDLNGKLYYDSKKNRLFEVSGKMYCMDRVQSIFIKGEPKFCHHDFSCSLNLAIDGAENQSGLSLHFGLKDKEKGFVLINFDNIDARNLWSAKRLVDQKVKQIQMVDCKSGLISGVIHLEFLKGRLLNLQLRKISARNLDLIDEKKNTSIFCKELELDLFYDPNQDNLKKIRDLKLKTPSAYIKHQIFGKSRCFLDCNALFSIKNGVFESSFIKCIHEGIDSQLVFLGDMQNVEMEGYFRSNILNMLKIFDQQMLSSKDHSSCLSFQAKLKKKNLDLSASLVCDSRDDQRVDLVAKSLNFDTISIDQFDEFHVHSKSLSKTLLDFIVQKISPECDLQGKFGFDLVYKEKKYFVAFEGNDARWQHDNLVLHSHTNVCGDRALKATAVFSNEFDLLDANCVIDNIFVKDQLTGLEARQIKVGTVYRKNCFDIDYFKFDMQGMTFEGHGMLRSASNGLFVKLISNQSIGSIAQINALFSHITPLKGVHLPFAGQVIGKKGGVELNISYQDKLDFDYKLDLLCKHATMPISEAHNLQDMGFRLVYDSKDDHLQVFNAEAILKTLRQESYLLKADASWFLGSAINAKVQACMGEKEIFDFHMMLDPDKKSFLLKSGSHLMNVPIDKCQIDSRSVNTAFDFSNYELAGLIDIAYNLNFISKDMFIKCSSELLASKIQARFVLDGNQSQYKARITANDSVLSGKKFKEIDLLFEKDGDLILMKNARLDNIMVKGSSCCMDRGIALNEFSYQDEKMSLLIDKGFFDYSQQLLTFDHHFQMNDNKLAISKINLRGSSEFALNSSEKKLIAKSFLEFDSNQYDLQFKSKKALNWSLDSSFNLSVDAFSGPLNVKDKIALLDVKEGRLSLLETNKSHVKGFLSYREGVQRLGQALGFNTIDVLSLDPIDVVDFSLENIRGDVSGSFNLNSYTHKNISLPLEFNQCRFFFDKNKIEFHSNCTLFNEEFQIMCLLQNAESVSIKLIKEGKNAAHLEGYLRKKNAPMLTSFYANLFGLSINISEQLSRDKNIKRFHLQTTFDLEKFKHTLSADGKKVIDFLELNKGYSLCGEIVAFVNDYKKSYFEGQIKGKKCDLLGYKIGSLYSTLYVDQKSVIMQNFSCADKAVSINIPEISVVLDKKGSNLKIPEFKLQNLRPSVLEKEGRKKIKVQPFIVQELIVKDIQGLLENSATLKGKGRLVFENHAPREHNIAQLPLEFISSLGLDRSLLVPVQGTMECDLKGLSLVFSSLKDSYSQGRRSIFFLSQKEPSYIDLKGNIFMNIKMKQNVLFKFTELFVLSIRGTLDDPVFSLQ